ncbi:tetratricopeptide repeat protein [Marinifilum sp. D737]|uniref:tetratricopeptide repeat protein n=1 Tax=Marinifilum sp. D737 TaxID=2969628 RepID=UPI002272C1FE|nr:hypothetical protein [Marinifilum sp. D737]MCY1634860.1 hypothetical protein [Marinifilum sp. D737]
MYRNKFYLLVLFVIAFSNQLFGQSFEELNKHAEQGDWLAQYNLGIYYYHGKETLVDKKKAFYWIKKSAEQGLDEAQYHIAHALITREMQS